MLHFKDIRNGYVEFKCDTCNTTKKVGFTCKSRFCTFCGKVYIDKWVDNMFEELMLSIDIWFLLFVFTIPEELRKFFGADRETLKILPKCAAKTVRNFIFFLNKS